MVNHVASYSCSCSCLVHYCFDGHTAVDVVDIGDHESRLAGDAMDGP